MKTNSILGDDFPSFVIKDLFFHFKTYANHSIYQNKGSPSLLSFFLLFDTTTAPQTIDFHPRINLPTHHLATSLDPFLQSIDFQPTFSSARPLIVCWYTQATQPYHYVFCHIYNAVNASALDLMPNNLAFICLTSRSLPFQLPSLPSVLYIFGALPFYYLLAEDAQVSQIKFLILSLNPQDHHPRLANRYHLYQTAVVESNRRKNDDKEGEPLF